MEKPVSLIIEEAENTIVNAINSVQLHPTLLEMIMRNLYLEVKERARVTSQKEKDDYKRAIMEETERENEDSESADDESTS